MKNKQTIALVILGLIVMISAVVFITMVNLENTVSSTKSKYNESVFEIQNPDDDARTFTVENTEIGYGNEDGAWATNQLSPSYNFGLRFTNVSIPKNVTIHEAWVELYSVGTPGLDRPNCKIYCDNSSNSSEFSDSIGVLNVTGRNYTNAFSIWNETADYGVWVKTPLINTQIKEVMNNLNWSQGNPITVLFVSNGLKFYSAAFQNYESGYPAKLFIKWT